MHQNRLVAGLRLDLLYIRRPLCGKEGKEVRGQGQRRQGGEKEKGREVRREGKGERGELAPSLYGDRRPCRYASPSFRISVLEPDFQKILGKILSLE